MVRHIFYRLYYLNHYIHKDINVKLSGSQLLLIFAFATCVVSAACEPMTHPSTFTKTIWDEDGEVKGKEEVPSVKFGDGTVVNADVLNRGKTAYGTFCSSCHGMNGDGKGPSAPGLMPPPRNFAAMDQKLQFKFAGVRAGDLPTDDDLVRLVTNGLHGTAMLKWDVSDTRLREIVQYIKTFSNRWFSTDETKGTQIEISPDPYKPETKNDAIRVGKRAYHLKTEAGCAVCHPAYITETEYASILTDAGQAVETLRPNAAWSEPKYSDTYEVKITPPDFTWHEMRSIQKVDPAATGAELEKQRAGRRKDLYRAIAAGIGGTAMPTWKGQLPEEKLWGLVYYVESLLDITANPSARAELMNSIRKAR
ncbi:MAG: c-type cytochrome [Planctomycetota bacterium]